MFTRASPPEEGASHHSGWSKNGMLSVAVSSESLEVGLKAKLLYDNMLPLVGFPLRHWLQNNWPWMTLNGYYTFFFLSSFCVITFVQIFTGILWRENVKRQWGAWALGHAVTLTFDLLILTLVHSSLTQIASTLKVWWNSFICAAL